MSQAPSIVKPPPEARSRLGMRARILLRLERFFPLLDAVPAITGDEAEFEFAKAQTSYAPFIEALGGLEGKTILDFGCGWGGESAWLAQRAGHVVGCDINDDALADAERFKQRLGLSNLQFARAGEQTLPFDDNHFDAAFSTNVFEHVMYPAQMLGELHRVLKPGGSLLSKFGPLLYSPLGYHMCWATQVPYAHLIFGFGPIVEVRNTKRAPWHPTSWKHTGLNGITFGQFRQAALQAGLQPKHLKRVAVLNMNLLAAIPVVGNLFTFGVECHLVKPLR